MNVIDNFLNKYSYRFPKGYPDLTDPADKKLMQELLSGIGINEAVKDDSNSIFATEGPEKNGPSYKQILRQDAKLDEKILNQIEKVFNDLAKGNDKYISNFNKTFRSKSITQIKDIFDAFSGYVNINDKGLGRGEVAAIMGIASSKSGGQATKDIIISNDGENDGEWDVKELTSSGEFRTASGGYITTTKFKKNLDYLISLFYQLRGEEEIKISLGPSKEGKAIDKAIDEILEYYQGGYKTGGISGGTFTKLEAVCNSIKILDTTGKTNSNYIKIAGRKFAVDSETYDKIKSGENIKNISVGEPISSENSILTKIKDHPWVENYKLIKENLSVIWDDYLNKIKGLIIVDPNTLSPILYTSEELKEKFAPYRVVQNQINVKAKDKIKENLDEDEDLYND
jgi:hypothetical protein